MPDVLTTTLDEPLVCATGVLAAAMTDALAKPGATEDVIGSTAELALVFGRAVTVLTLAITVAFAVSLEKLGVGYDSAVHGVM